MSSINSNIKSKISNEKTYGISIEFEFKNESILFIICLFLLFLVVYQSYKISKNII